MNNAIRVTVECRHPSYKDIIKWPGWMVCKPQVGDLVEGESEKLNFKPRFRVQSIVHSIRYADYPELIVVVSP